jgi:DNA-binding response OmpR family regulator
MKSQFPLVTVPSRKVLVVDTAAVTAHYLPQMRQDLCVTAVDTWEAAMAVLPRQSPALVITELDLPGGAGEEICRAAKSLAHPATVLVTTSLAERAPSALMAGCDAILLKPFAPNLLYARIGRLLRRSVELRLRGQQQSAKASYLLKQSTLLSKGTNRTWPSTHCPYCQHLGVTSFDHASYRRDWYACLACGKVWMAKRQDDKA